MTTQIKGQIGVQITAMQLSIAGSPASERYGRKREAQTKIATQVGETAGA